MARARITLALGLALLGGAVLAVPSLAQAAEQVALPYDLDGDERQELVVGLPDTTEGAGGVAVLAGERRRVLGRSVLLTQASLGVPPEAWAPGCGSSLASGDFDGDGRADLAIGCPGAGAAGRGAVVVVYGSAPFPGARRDVLELPRDRAGEPLGGFGAALVAGDFNGDGFADIASGGLSGDHVEVGYGAAEGAASGGRRVLPGPQRGGVPTLVAGDLDGDTFDDLGEVHPTGAASGERGMGVGFGQEIGPLAIERVDARFASASSAALGDVSWDRRLELVLGSPDGGYIRSTWRAAGTRGAPGAVLMFRGERIGPAGSPQQELVRSRPGIPGEDRAGDRFGESVAVGRLDRDRYADIVAGAPGEQRGRGRVTIIRGARHRYARKGNRTLDLSTRGVPGDVRKARSFGIRLALLDHDGDGRVDLTVLDRPRRASGSGRGAITVLPGTRRGFFDTRRARRIELSGLASAYSGAIVPVIGRPGASR